MNIFSSYILLDIINVFLLLFFVVFLLTLRKKPKLSNYLLAAFLFSLAMSYMDGVFISLSYFFYRPYPYIVHFTMSFDFLVGPTLYFYLLSLISRKGMHTTVYPEQIQLEKTASLLEWKRLWHFIPFVLHFLFIVFNVRQGGFSHSAVIFLVIASSLHISSYIILVLYTLTGFKQKLKNIFSDETPYSFSWLMIVVSGLFFVGLLRFSNNMLWLYYPQSPFHHYVDLKVFDVVGVFVFACALVFHALRDPKLFHWDIVRTLDKAVGKPEKKYETSALDEATGKEAQFRIEHYMLESKAYLQPDFNLASLAEAAGMPAHQVSQVLNVYIGKNFFDFVNAYRIDECRKLLRNDSTTQSITEIMYAVGFRSKSVFNTAFKRSVGQTPSQFRKRPISA